MSTSVSVIVPTLNEEGNVAELVSRLTTVLTGREAEIIFVDDSTDNTMAKIGELSGCSALPVRGIHRKKNDSGLAGAVITGLSAARHSVCVVLDADLQHPPELIPSLIARYEEGGADVVAASRYIDGGSWALGTALRFALSRAATWLTRAMFPVRLWHGTDPMTGYFLLNRDRVDLAGLQPHGFKILLEVLVRNDLHVAEIPLAFGRRSSGVSKATVRQGVTFLTHLARLRFGTMGRFALIGALGAVANLIIMWLLIWAGVSYVWAAIVAAEFTIIGNFVLQERFVFAEVRKHASRLGVRFVSSFTFNNAEAALRIPLLVFLVENWHFSRIFAAALTLALAFLVRFLFHALVVYAPRKKAARTMLDVRT